MGSLSSKFHNTEPRDLAEAHPHRGLLVVFPSDGDRCILKLTLPVPVRETIKGVPSQRKAARKHKQTITMTTLREEVSQTWKNQTLNFTTNQEIITREVSLRNFTSMLRGLRINMKCFPLLMSSLGKPRSRCFDICCAEKSQKHNKESQIYPKHSAV